MPRLIRQRDRVTIPAGRSGQFLRFAPEAATKRPRHKRIWLTGWRNSSRRYFRCGAKGPACMCSLSSKRLDVLGTQSSSQAARIAGRVAAGGNTYHKPSSCRKKNIANDRPGLVDSTQTQRPSRYTLSLSWKRLMRIGEVSEGASHLSINLRKQYPS